MAEQADHAMKDVYMLDMLAVAEPMLEAEFEARKEYFIDLLFFSRRLQALVAFELKTGRFKPEYAGYEFLSQFAG